ncbi:hypothetical protein [Thalassobacillus hwangdonensis]|uniref:Tissue inhibitor of metalloproteinase n=1 Tax=Thalassobacillus hwangdonensis TaxID=546108 RepID=A0ABW3KUS5_9BACI
MRQISILMIALIFFYGSFLFTPNKSHACSCAEASSPSVQLEKKDAVFFGEVMDISSSMFSSGEVTVLFEVDRVWKGVNQTEVKVVTKEQEASCGYNFAVGARYLVYASADGDDWKTGLCEGTKHLNEASGDIRELGYGDKPEEQVNLSLGFSVWSIGIPVFLAIAGMSVFIKKRKKLS